MIKTEPALARRIIGLSGKTRFERRSRNRIHVATASSVATCLEPNQLKKVG
jgi:hypothetical protein